MELKEAIKEIRKGKIIVDEKSILDNKFFLFGKNDIIYYVCDYKINEDKMELAIKNNNRPSLLAESWWENKWEIYKEDNKNMSPSVFDNWKDSIKEEIDKAKDVNELREILEDAKGLED